MDLDNMQRKYGLPAPLPVVQNGKFATRFPLNLEHRGDDVFQFGGKYIGEIENIYDLLYKILTNQEIDASLALPYAIKITEDKLYVRDKTNSEWILIFDITKPNFPKEIELYELIYKAITHQVIGEDTSYPGQFRIEENILYVRDKDNLTWTQIGDVTKEFLGATEATQAILDQVNEILTEVQELKTELNRQIATTNETLTTALKAANEAMTSAQSINIRTFNSVEEMKASNTLKAGALAKTLGFYTAGDGGGADYLVTDNIGKDEVDEASVITLQNELYAKLLVKDYINVKQFGAYGDGKHDDTLILNICAEKSVNKTLYFPSGRYLSGTINITHGDNKEGKSPTITKGDGTGTVIIAKEDTTLLINAKNLSSKKFSDFILDGGNQNCILMDTTTNYTDYSPSIRNIYERITLRNYTETAWIADQNNDSEFNMISWSSSVENAVALHAYCNGGLIALSRCYAFSNALEIAGQIIDLNDCGFAGIRIIAPDWNILNINGGYYYADSEYHSNIYIKNEYEVSNIYLNHAHIENKYGNEDDASILNGTGKIFGGVKAIGGHIFGTEKNAKIKFFGDTLQISSGISGSIFENVFLDKINLNESLKMRISQINCIYDGSVQSEALKLHKSSDGLQSVYGINNISLGEVISSNYPEMDNKESACLSLNFKRVNNSSGNGTFELTYYNGDIIKVGSFMVFVTPLTYNTGISVPAFSFAVNKFDYSSNNFDISKLSNTDEGIYNVSWEGNATLKLQIIPKGFYAIGVVGCGA